MEALKKYFFILPLVVAGVVLPLHFAHANFFTDLIVGGIIDGAGGFVLSIFTAVLLLLVPIAVFFASLAGSFMYSVLNIGLFYTKCVGVPEGQCFIDLGWTLARDIVNIALIVAIVIIALFTILGNENYGARKALVPFIAVAILVNFSRVFVGVVVDLSNIVMNVFVDAMPTLGNMGEFFKLSTENIGKFSLNIEDGISNLLRAAVAIIYFSALAFILALYGIIFAVRYGALWVLTIMSPVALASWIFPSTKKIFNLWRDQLIQWSFIGIPLLFFLWISLISFAQLKAINPDTIAANSNLSESGLNVFFNDIFSNLFLLIMLYIAFAFGMKTSAMGAGMIISTGKKWGKAAGIATTKFAGRMGWRGAVVGARKGAPVAGLAGRGIRAGVRKMGEVGGPRLRAVGAWRAGAPKRRFNKNNKNRRRIFNKAGWNVNQYGNVTDENGNPVRDKNNKALRSDTSWDNLTPEQQKKFTEQMRSKAARRAARVLGKGRQSAAWIRSNAKRIASTPFMALTPEEQKALWSAVTLERFRKANKTKTQKEMKNLTDKDLGDPDSLRKTITKETDRNKRLAAQILLLQNGGASLSSKEKMEIGKKAKAAGLSSEVYGSLDPAKGELQEVFGDENTPRGSRALRNHTAAAQKALDEELKAIANMAEDATRSLMKTATNIHTKVAAAQKLANEKALTQQDFSDFEKFAQNSAQFGQLAKRYIHFAKEGLPPTNPNSINNITKKMSSRDYAEIHEDLFSPANLEKAKEFYRAAADAGIAEMSKNGKLRQGFQGFITKNPGELANNPAVLDYLQRISASRSPFKYSDVP